ncbi:MAG TPA: site-specific DNA-methyltransferase [Mycobacterium sp.]|jgi:adenine-specific DNA-methyltransferase|nr:site-specific DNA-methyltransferase [Mycobacterium sp.]
MSLVHRIQEAPTRAPLSPGKLIPFPVQGPRADIVLGDVLEYLRSLRDESVQLVVSSPPYNVGKEYEQRLSQKDYIAWQSLVIKELVRVTKPGGSICWQVGNGIDNGEVIPLDAIFYPIFKSHGLKLRNRIIWTFGHGLHARRRFSGRHESILWFTKGDNYVFDLDAVRVPVKYPNKKHFKGPRLGELSSNPAGKNPGDVWEIPNVKANHLEKTAHPCQFPVGLVERLVLALTLPGDEVLDPFLGSGSTVLAAVKNGRIGMGVDNTPGYVEIAQARLAQLRQGTLRTRPMNKPVFEPGVKE